MKKFLLALTLMATAAGAAAVEKRYVTDTLWLQLRSGPSTEYRILQALPSGEHLIVIEEDAETGYTKVKTDKGQEGFVLSRFLEMEPIAKEKLVLANRELEKVKAELETTRTQRNELRTEVEKLKSERSGLGRSKNELEEELNRIKTISANALELDEKARTLTERNQELELQLESISAENAQLHDNRQQTYLLYGGGLVVLGIFAGLILPSLRGKRSSGWS